MRMDKFTNGAAIGTGSTTVVFGALSLNDWAIIVGIACTVGTFALNWYYKRKEFQLRSGQKNG
ncbi:phage holin family protein [Pectobacterium carotovorum]|uniref:phage holin family protein n=1 Tax=Pectobacterium TaxID=122277 RepID=UPI0015DF0425|nr:MULTISPECIES: phage holin family protein [Pectobacterium]MBA0188276.1 phage holin family protein [Pectobacterium odoriferum]MBQ4788061.1 holin [Pectobacterium versatile]UVD99389.1 phage holin family protein [Pectobacterium parvum]